MEIGNQQALFHEVKNTAEELVFISLDKKEELCGKGLWCSIKGFVTTLISCATSKFRKLDDWPHIGEENLIIAAFGIPAFLH